MLSIISFKMILVIGNVCILLKVKKNSKYMSQKKLHNAQNLVRKKKILFSVASEAHLICWIQSKLLSVMAENQPLEPIAAPKGST